MPVPQFIKEVIWSVYPPRYKQLADKKFRKSLGYMSKVLLIAFLIAGLLFLPKLFTLKSTIQEEFSKFEMFTVSGEIKQTAPVIVPQTNPWIAFDLNADRNLTKEIFVIDKDNIRYRLFGIKSIPREHLKNPGEHQASASGFFAKIILLMLPGIVLLLYLRMWLKYFLLIILAGTLFFIIMELTKWRLRWKQMLNIATHALTLVIIIELIFAVFAAGLLLPILPFLGVNIYAITTGLYMALIVFGIVGYHTGAKSKR